MSPDLNQMVDPDNSETRDDRYRSTLDVYEARADDWLEFRSAKTNYLEEFAAELGSRPGPGEGMVVDLGCGPGWHLDDLPVDTVAMDAAEAMLELASVASPETPLVQGDLRQLPFAKGSLRAAWANKSYVHIARVDMPMALRDLHRALAPGGITHLGLFGGDVEYAGFDGDEFSGRSFSLWPTQLLSDVLAGAGFTIEKIQQADPLIGSAPFIGVRVRREHTLADTVGADMLLLLVGLNPSLPAAESGVGFSGPSNRGWPALEDSGLAEVGSRDPEALLRDGHIGMTDIVKRATRGADELSKDEYRCGMARLERLCDWLQPAAVCIIGLTGWRAAMNTSAKAGLQSEELGGRPVWLMPNPSGLNAHVTRADLAEHFRAAVALGAGA